MEQLQAEAPLPKDEDWSLTEVRVAKREKMLESSLWASPVVALGGAIATLGKWRLVPLGTLAGHNLKSDVEMHSAHGPNPLLTERLRLFYSLME